MNNGTRKRKRPGRKPTGQIITSGSMTKEMLTKVTVISGHRRISKSEVLEKYGGPGIDREYRRVLDEMQRDVGVSQVG